MSRLYAGFDPHDPDAIWISEAREALEYNRPLLDPKTLDRLLRGKWRDPLMGVYGLYLKLLDVSDLHKFSGDILDNVRSLLGDDHPDVIALRLKFDPGGSSNIGRIAAPPLLYQAWQQILTTSRSNNQLIPPDSPLSRLSENFVSMRPWLIHRVPPSSIYPSSEQISLARGKRALAAVFGELQVKLQNPRAYERIGELVAESTMSELERQIISQVSTALKRQSTPIDQEKETPEDRAERLFKSLRAPGYSIAAAALRLAQKLGS